MWYWLKILIKMCGWKIQRKQQKENDRRKNKRKKKRIVANCVLCCVLADIGWCVATVNVLAFLLILGSGVFRCRCAIFYPAPAATFYFLLLFHLPFQQLWRWRLAPGVFPTRVTSIYTSARLYIWERVFYYHICFTILYI